MLNKVSRAIACLLLVLMPWQVVAATSMAACNSMMQVTLPNEHTTADMPCHKQHAVAAVQIQKNASCHNACQSYCAAMSASLNVISLTSNMLKLAEGVISVSISTQPAQAYASITQSNLLRPPIVLS